MEYEIEWHPRYYYVLLNKTSGVFYLGQTKKDMKTSSYRGSGPYWINHCKKHGGHNTKNVVVYWSKWFEDRDDARKFLIAFEKQEGAYWLDENTKWANRSPENLDNQQFLVSEDVRKENGIKNSITRNNPTWKQTIGKDAKQRASETLKKKWANGELTKDDFNYADVSGGNNPRAKPVVVHDKYYPCVEDAMKDLGLKRREVYDLLFTQLPMHYFVNEKHKPKNRKVKKGRAKGERNGMANPIHADKVRQAKIGLKGLIGPEGNKKMARPDTDKWNTLISEGYSPC